MDHSTTPKTLPATRVYQPNDNTKGAENKKVQEQLRQISPTPIFDNMKIKPKTRSKSSKCQNPNFTPTKHTNHDIDEKGLYNLLEIAVQNHIETQLSRRHTGHKPYRRFSRRPSDTEIHKLNHHKRQHFCMIQNYVQQYIDFALNTKNDHSAPQMTNRLRYDTPGDAESREDIEIFFPPPSPLTLLAHNSHNSKSFLSNKHLLHNQLWQTPAWKLHAISSPMSYPYRYSNGFQNTLLTLRPTPCGTSRITSYSLAMTN
jgi:hypothetical protein